MGAVEYASVLLEKNEMKMALRIRDNHDSTADNPLPKTYGAENIHSPSSVEVTKAH